MANQLGGLAGWLMKRLRAGKDAHPRLELVERITIAPRQTVALIEAEGRRLLVACTADGGPTIYPLESGADSRTRGLVTKGAQRKSRVSW
jgi:flagellar biogenesis protein FliO